MAQFDVFVVRSSGSLVVDVQSDLLDPLNTRVVVPLLAMDSGLIPAKRLNPVLKIGETDLILATQLMAAVQFAEFGDAVENIAHERDTITAALDMVFQGF